MLRSFLSLHVTEDNINEFGRFDKLKATVDKEKAHKYFEFIEGGQVPLRKVTMKINEILRRFVLEGGFDL